MHASTCHTHRLASCAFFAGVLFACNAYHIGKERCYFKGALACGYRIWVSPRRRKTLARLDLPHEWLELLTFDVAKCDVIISDQGVSPPRLQALHEEYQRPIVGFQCTGARSAAPLCKDCLGTWEGLRAHRFASAGPGRRCCDCIRV